ncbi:MAG: 50S ribosomal protein L18 [Candidatus Daviesbacteria bacterium]|nr:MAG: 50S ribosomal protein L18 [Candidatus Daviesbacteria bacterium]
MKKTLRDKIHHKIRQQISGNTKTPRLSVFRSGQHIYAQIIDDSQAVTLVAASDLKIKNGSKKEKAYRVGKMLAEAADKKKISSVVFDRGGFIFHGRVAEVARGAREGGLKF